MVTSENDAVKLAVAVNDIEWMKNTMTETRDDIKEISTYIKSQDDKYATKAELGLIRRDVETLKAWRYYIMGGIALAAFIAVELARSIKF